MSSRPLTLTLKRNPVWKPNGPMDYARSARKWKIAPTEQAMFYVHENTLMRRSESHINGQEEGTTEGGAPVSSGGETVSGTKVPAKDVQNDLEYVVPVGIGTPPITANLDFDTGSSDLWVWSSFLPSSVNKSVHNVYDPTKSSTAKQESALTWWTPFGDGSYASGPVYSDTITLGGNLTVLNQAFAAVKSLSNSYLSDDASDGLLGLAFPSINNIHPTPQATLVENMIDEGVISKPIFTAKLDKGDSEGFYTFGYVDESVTTNPITYATIDSSNGFWEFASPTLTINGTVHQRASPKNTAIADTGTTLILVDDAMCKAIYESIPGAKLDHSQGGWVLPNTVDPSSLPDIGFAVEGTTYTIPGSDLIFAAGSDGTYFGSIQSRGWNRQDILGDVFLKRVYAIFDQTPDAPRIGFAQR
ncbi:acid protease [Clavulina sp. PMI_390]|nr:acid protease [Clavulina sp. PMI_390]